MIKQPFEHFFFIGKTLELYMYCMSIYREKQAEKETKLPKYLNPFYTCYVHAYSNVFYIST